ncbi:MAG: hypothetical protein AAGA56_10345 [Myxococcota bacterium]
MTILGNTAVHPRGETHTVGISLIPAGHASGRRCLRWIGHAPRHAPRALARMALENAARVERAVPPPDELVGKRLVERYAVESSWAAAAWRRSSVDAN